MNYYNICNSCNYVDQSKIIISKNKLVTSQVGTCSILLFSFNKINFMAHIDALQNTTNELIKKIEKNFDINKLSKIKVYIIPGAWCNTKCYTTKLIINALKKLKIEFIFYKKKIKWNNTISINHNNITII
jgi:hypothetical protein